MAARSVLIVAPLSIVEDLRTACPDIDLTESSLDLLEDAVVRVRAVRVPAASRCISVRMVVSASPPVVGLLNRTAACPGSTSVPGTPSAASSSWAEGRDVDGREYSTAPLLFHSSEE